MLKTQIILTLYTGLEIGILQLTYCLVPMVLFYNSQSQIMT